MDYEPLYVVLHGEWTEQVRVLAQTPTTVVFQQGAYRGEADASKIDRVVEHGAQWYEVQDFYIDYDVWDAKEA